MQCIPTSWRSFGLAGCLTWKTGSFGCSRRAQAAASLPQRVVLDSPQRLQDRPENALSVSDHVDVGEHARQDRMVGAQRMGIGLEPDAKIGRPAVVPVRVGRDIRNAGAQSAIDREFISADLDDGALSEPDIGAVRRR